MADRGGASREAAGFERFVERSYEGELGGYTFTELRADGSARRLEGDLERKHPDDPEDRTRVPVWRLLEFRLEAEEVEELERLIAEADFRGLDARHPEAGDRGSGDVPVEYVLEDEDGVHRVRSEAGPPEALRELDAWIRESVLAPRRDSIAERPAMGYEEARELWEEVVGRDEG